MAGTEVLDLSTVNVDIGKEEVLSIAISRAEDILHEKISEARKRTEDLNKKIEEVKKEMEKLIDDDIESSTKQAVEDLRKSLKFFEKEILVEASALDFNSEKGIITANITIVDSNKNKYMQLFHKFKISDKALYDTKFDLMIKRTEEYKESLEDQKKWREKLANMPRLERRWKGLLAEKELSKSEKGKKMLELLTSGIEDQIDKLVV